MLPNNSFHLIEDNISQQPKKEKNDSQGQKQNITSFNNQENALLKPLKEFLEISSGNKEILR